MADIEVTGRPQFENAVLRFKEEVKTFFTIANRSQTVTARNVRVTLGDRYHNPRSVAPQSLLQTVDAFGRDLPATTAECLRMSAGGECLLGEIPPGGEVSVIVESEFARLPVAELDHPFNVLVDLRAAADNEVHYANNDHTVTYRTRIPVAEIERVAREGDELDVVVRVLRPGDVPPDGMLLECANSISGPWVPCSPPLRIDRQNRFIRPRGY